MNQRKKDLEIISKHLTMLQYCWDAGSLAIGSSLHRSEIPWLFYTFANYHLIATLFLVDKKKSEMGGAIYLLLRRHKLDTLLDPIRAILNRPIGQTTFGDFIRHERNKLMVHGDLRFGNLPKAVQEVPKSNRLNSKFQQTFADFAEEIRTLAARIRKELHNANRVKRRRITGRTTTFAHLKLQK